MNQNNKSPVVLEYFNQGSESLFFYKDALVNYLKELLNTKNYQLLDFIFLKVLGVLFLPFHLLFTDKKQIKLTWEIIRQLSPRRYKGCYFKKLLALLVWEFRYLHFQLVVFFIKPNYFLCADSAFFLLRWMDFCKKKNIKVIRDFTDFSYCFSIIRDSRLDARTNYDFNLDPEDIDPAKLEAYREEFDMRLNGVSKNMDHVMAYNPNNSFLNIKSSKKKVLLATHIFGDAASAHISMFESFEDWTKFFLNFFADKTDDYLLIVKEHPLVVKYEEEGLLLRLIGNSMVARNVMYIPGHVQLSHEDIDIVITGNGSIGHEYIYRKKPVMSTSGGFCKRYYGCYFAKTQQDITRFFDNQLNIEKLRIEAEQYNEYNLKLSYIFHKCPNLLNNEQFRTAFDSRDYNGIASFFDKAGLIDFILQPENKNHYFVLEPKLIS
jgi:hypothetical protein